MFFFKAKEKSKVTAKKPGTASHVHLNRANALKKRSVSARKAKRYMDSFLFDAQAFHEMRLFEEDLFENEVKGLEYSLSLGVITKREYSIGVVKAKKFLESWSGKDAAIRMTHTAMSKLKLSENQQSSIANSLVKWSASGGGEHALSKIASKLGGE